MVENSGLRKCLIDIQTELLADNVSSADETNLTNISLVSLLMKHFNTFISDIVSGITSRVFCFANVFTVSMSYYASVR